MARGSVFLFIISATLSDAFITKNESSAATLVKGVRLAAKPIGQDDDRRAFLGAVLAGAGTATPFVLPTAALADYGKGATIKTPGLGDYIEFLIETTATVDESSFLYKGADRQVQLKRIAEAALRLEEIPGLADEKKWSQVQGILTGPLGTLLQTMNQVAAGNGKAQTAAKQVKTDLYAIGDGATKKSQDIVKKSAAAASKSLEAFLKTAF